MIFSGSGLARTTNTKGSSKAKDPATRREELTHRTVTARGDNGCMVTMDTLTTEKRQAVLDVGRKYGARSIRVFGSVARGENPESSDVDSLVEFDKGRTLFDLIRFRLELRELLGTEVDVVTPGNLRYLRSRILAEARPI